MSTPAGSPDKSHSPKALSDADALDVKGGATVSSSPVASAPSPILKPIKPRSMEPCI